MNEFSKAKERILEDILIEIMNKKESEKLKLVFTFSSSFLSIHKKLKEINKKLEKIQFTEIFLSEFKSDKELKKRAYQFLKTCPSQFLFVKVYAKTETMHFYCLQNLLFRLMKGYFDIKHILIVVYYKQDLIHESKNFNVSSEWEMLFIDDLFEGISQELQTQITSPKITDILKDSREMIINNFDQMVDLYFDNLCRKWENLENLEISKTFFINFRSKYPEQAVSFIVSFILKSIETDPGISCFSFVFELIVKTNDYLIQSVPLSNQIKLSIERIVSQKICKLLEILETEKLIYSLHCYHKLNDKEMIEFLINLVTANIKSQHFLLQINQSKVDFQCLYLYSHKEIEKISSLKIEDDDLSAKNSKMIKIVYSKYLKKVIKNYKDSNSSINQKSTFRF